MSYSIDQDLCTGCGTCALVCPVETLSADGGSASIDDYLCILCGACEMHCTQRAVLFDGKRPPLPILKPPESSTGAQQFSGC